MAISPDHQQRRERYLQTLIEAARPLQQSDDPEVALEALIDATQMLKERLQSELAELRQEQVE